jgi:hypothetical protein
MSGGGLTQPAAGIWAGTGAGLGTVDRLGAAAAGGDGE